MAIFNSYVKLPEGTIYLPEGQPFQHHSETRENALQEKRGQFGRVSHSGQGADYENPRWG